MPASEEKPAFAYNECVETSVNSSTIHEIAGPVTEPARPLFWKRRYGHQAPDDETSMNRCWVSSMGRAPDYGPAQCSRSGSLSLFITILLPCYSLTSSSDMSMPSDAIKRLLVDYFSCDTIQYILTVRISGTTRSLDRDRGLRNSFGRYNG